VDCSYTDPKSRPSATGAPGSVARDEARKLGATWTHVSTGANGSQLDSGSPVSIVVDPVNQGTMYVAEIYGPPGVWKSTNGGVDWDCHNRDNTGLHHGVRHSALHTDNATIAPGVSETMPGDAAVLDTAGKAAATAIALVV
jgi:hypothetical protein